MADRHTSEQGRITRQRHRITVGGERTGYEFYTFDSRTDAEQRADYARGGPQDPLIVVLPGHGQTAFSTAHLVAYCALHSRAGVAWMVNIDPSAGGDPAQAQALPAILRRHWVELGGPESRPPSRGIILCGWSHGGGEGLHAAAAAPDLIRAVVGMCPTGLIERQPGELIVSFVGECARIAVRALTQGWAAFWHVLRVGADVVGGVVGDLVHTRSLHCVVDHIRWAAAKVSGPGYAYDGSVVLLFAADDTVIRWRDIFPDSRTPADIESRLADYRHADFPCAGDLAVRVLPGNHLSPGIDRAYAITALTLTGQLRAPAE